MKFFIEEGEKDKKSHVLSTPKILYYDPMGRFYITTKLSTPICKNIEKDDTLAIVAKFLIKLREEKTLFDPQKLDWIFVEKEQLFSIHPLFNAPWSLLKWGMEGSSP